MAKQEVGNYPSELVHLYGKETIDECIRVIVEFEKNSKHLTLYEFLEDYVPQAKLTLFQAENVVYAVDNFFANAGYYFASDDDLNQINDRGLVPYVLVKYLKSLDLV